MNEETTEWAIGKFPDSAEEIQQCFEGTFSVNNHSDSVIIIINVMQLYIVSIIN